MFKNLRVETQNRLSSLAAGMAGVEPDETLSIEFTVSTVLDAWEDIFEKLDSASRKAYPYIYCISAVSDDNLPEIRGAFMEAKAQEKRDRAYARLNEHTSRCFYVGSSSNLPKRIREHLGYGAKSTFSLHLAHWAEGFPELKLVLTAAMYPVGTESEILQALEDTLWERNRPMFGRKGSR